MAHSDRWKSMLEDGEIDAAKKPSQSTTAHKKPATRTKVQHEREATSFTEERGRTRERRTVHFTHTESDRAKADVPPWTNIDPRLLETVQDGQDSMDIDVEPRLLKPGEDHAWKAPTVSAHSEMVPVIAPEQFERTSTAQQLQTLVEHSEWVNELLDAGPVERRIMVRTAYARQHVPFEKLDRPPLYDFLEHNLPDLAAYCLEQYLRQTFICAVWINYDPILLQAYHDPDRKKLCGKLRISKHTRARIMDLEQAGYRPQRVQFKICTPFQELALVDFEYSERLRMIEIITSFKSREHSVVLNHIVNNMGLLQPEFTKLGRMHFGIHQLDDLAERFILE